MFELGAYSVNLFLLNRESSCERGEGFSGYTNRLERLLIKLDPLWGNIFMSKFSEPP